MNPLLTGIVNQTINNNPQIKQVMDYIRQNGNDPKQAFYNLAKEKGVDPNEVLKQVNNFAKL